MPKGYTVRYMAQSAPCLSPAQVFDPGQLPAPWAALDEAQIAHYPWAPEGYCPPAAARVGWNEEGLHALLYAREAEIRAEMVGCEGAACQDSCLEFFIAPNPEQVPLYWNLECTPRPAIHWGEGAARPNRRKFHSLPDGFNLTASRHDGGWWAVSYTLPAALLKETFGVTLAPGLAMRGNFYKCGDLTAIPHYGMWVPYDTATVPQPDFHRPELFAPITLA